MNLKLELETFYHQGLFDLNILSFDVSNVHKMIDNCGLYSRDYENLFENIVHIAKELLDDTLKDGKEFNMF